MGYHHTRRQKKLARYPLKGWVVAFESFDAPFDAGWWEAAMGAKRRIVDEGGICPFAPRSHTRSENEQLFVVHPPLANRPLTLVTNDMAVYQPILLADLVFLMDVSRIQCQLSAVAGQKVSKSGFPKTNWVMWRTMAAAVPETEGCARSGSDSTLGFAMGLGSAVRENG